MSTNKSISTNIEEIISKTTKETAKAVVQELRVQRYLKEDRGHFRKVELLLYNYNNLKAAIKQKEEDIQYIKGHGLPQKSKSIMFYQTSGGFMSTEERYMQLIEKYEAEMVETEREINKIDNALSKVINDKYYGILELKYINNDKLTDEEIAEKLGKDQSTITRNRKRLINTLKVILFPESIKDFA